MIPKDFGGLHPDPNLTYAADLYKQACEQKWVFFLPFLPVLMFFLLILQHNICMRFWRRWSMGLFYSRFFISVFRLCSPFSNHLRIATWLLGARSSLTLATQSQLLPTALIAFSSLSTSRGWQDPCQQGLELGCSEHNWILICLLWLHSQALDKVAEKKGVKCYVVPTGKRGTWDAVWVLNLIRFASFPLQFHFLVLFV